MASTVSTSTGNGCESEAAQTRASLLFAQRSVTLGAIGHYHRVEEYYRVLASISGSGFAESKQVSGHQNKSWLQLFVSNQDEEVLRTIAVSCAAFGACQFVCSTCTSQ